MKQYPLLLTATFLFSSVSPYASAQGGSMAGNYMPNLTGMTYTLVVDEVRFEGVDNKAGVLRYGDIKGSAFWSDEWQLASLYSFNDGLLGRAKVKVNLLKQEVHYIDRSGDELVLPNERVGKVVIHPGMDSNAVKTVFRNPNGSFLMFNKPVREWVEELNTGNLKLIKLAKRRVNSADSLFGTLKRYYFSTDQYYFVSYNRSVNQVKKLGKESILTFVPRAHEFDTWIQDNKINFKKEEDIVRFFDYYNAQKSE
jgi:hypothetical protein